MGYCGVMLSYRMQILLTEEQRARLRRRAQEEGVSVGALVRQAVDAYLASPVSAARRSDGLRRLYGLEAPVANWDDMKAEIEAGRFG
jgi:hypothetical protein